MVWVAAWIVLHLMWKDKPVAMARAFGATLILIAIGVVGTFPIFFEMFAH